VTQIDLNSSDYLTCQENYYKPNYPGVVSKAQSFQSSQRLLLVNTTNKAKAKPKTSNKGKQEKKTKNNL
jgi:hypothetical protein